MNGFAQLLQTQVLPTAAYPILGLVYMAMTGLLVYKAWKAKSIKIFDTKVMDLLYKGLIGIAAAFYLFDIPTVASAAFGFIGTAFVGVVQIAIFGWALPYLTAAVITSAYLGVPAAVKEFGG